MNEIYWITRLDLISGWLTALSIISGIIVLCASVGYLANKDDYEEHEWKDSKNWMIFSAKIFKNSTFCLFLFLTSSILTPTTKEAMLIFGVGSTIDYLSENEVAKQIPDNCIKALNEWVESLSDDKNDSKNR